MSTLPSTVNTVQMERRVRSAARHAGIVTSRNASVFFEHGHWWVENAHTGAQWDAVDTNDGFDFEQVTDGEDR